MLSIADCVNRFAQITSPSDRLATGCSGIGSPTTDNLAGCLLRCCNNNCNAINYHVPGPGCNIKTCTATGLHTYTLDDYDIHALIGT